MKRRILCVALSVVLLSLPWLGGSALTLFVAFVPLLWVQNDLAGAVNRKGRPRKFWPYAVATFALWWLATVWWVGFAAVIGVVAATLVGTVLMSAAFLIYHAVWRRAKRPLAYTVLVTAWLAYEYIYLHNDQISFPWLVLGNGFAQDVRLVQWYEYTGALGGSLWVLVVNLLVFEASKRWRQWRSWIAPAGAIVLPAVLSWIIYATYKEPSEKIEISVVQPNVDPYRTKFRMSQYRQLTLLLDLMRETPRSTQVIVAPETAVNEYCWEEYLNELESMNRIRDFVRGGREGAMVVTGAMTYVPYESEQVAPFTARMRGGQWLDRYNSALGIDTSRHIRVHHKAKLVIGAEMTPYYQFLKDVKFLTVDLGGVSGQLGYGDVRQVFTTPSGVRIGPAICYEAIYGEYYTEFVRNGAEVMCVISNDGWWRDTPGYRYLFAYSRLRAVETRRSIARSANTGISGFIDQRGDTSGKLGWNVRDVSTRSLATNDRMTFYTRYGDLIGRIGCYVFVLSMLYFMAYRIKRRSHIVD